MAEGDEHLRRTINIPGRSSSARKSVSAGNRGSGEGGNVWVQSNANWPRSSHNFSVSEHALEFDRRDMKVMPSHVQPNPVFYFPRRIVFPFVCRPSWHTPSGHQITNVASFFFFFALHLDRISGLLPSRYQVNPECAPSRWPKLTLVRFFFFEFPNFSTIPTTTNFFPIRFDRFFSRHPETTQFRKWC